MTICVINEWTSSLFEVMSRGAMTICICKTRLTYRYSRLVKIEWYKVNDLSLRSWWEGNDHMC